MTQLPFKDPLSEKRGPLWISLFFLLLIFIPGALFGEEPRELIYAFQNFSSTTRPEEMLLVGEIKNKTKTPEPDKIDSPFLNYDTRPDQVTVKVLNRSGIKVGQKLYVIEKDPYHKQYRNGLIVGEIVVGAIFHNPFYGWVLTGTGNLLRVHEGNFVARTLDSENLDRAFALKKLGDHYVKQGNLEQAISSYNEALEADLSLPEAHAALGKLYLDLARESGREDPVRALAEFQQAWKYLENFRYRYDEFKFYLDYMNALYFHFHIRRFRDSDRSRLSSVLDRIVEVGKKGLQLKPEDTNLRVQLFRAHYHRMDLYRTRKSPEERQIFEEERQQASQFLEGLLQSPVAESEMHRVAILYYHRLLEDRRTRGFSGGEKIVRKLYGVGLYSLRRSSRGAPEAKSDEERLKELIAYHVDRYYRFYSKEDPEFDPEVREIWRSLK